MRFPLPHACAALVAVALSALPAPGGHACTGDSPAFPVDAALWGRLRPALAGQVHFERDSTDYNGLVRPDWRFPLYAAIDLEGDHAFTVYSSGFRIWEIGTPASQRDPALVGFADGWLNTFPAWVPGNSESRELVFGVDVPDGNDDLAAVAALSPIGISIWDTSDKDDPTGIYADTGRSSFQVYAATIAGNAYAFAAAEQTGIGLHVYDMTAATDAPGCVEDTTTLPILCGVYAGAVQGGQPFSYVHGVETSAGRHFLAATSGVSVRGVGLWEVTNPAFPVNVRTGGGRFLDGEFIFGVALWENGTSRYLGLVKSAGGSVAQIYDVTACLNGGCTSLGSPLWTSPPLRGSGVRRFLTASKVGATPYLYVGLDDMCSPGLHREYLYQVDTPAAPVEIGVEAEAVNWPNPGGSPNPYPIDYWSWSYAKSPTGFSQVQPRAAKFSDAGFLYRAAWTLFDVHELRPDILFADDFESGNLAAWSASD